MFVLPNNENISLWSVMKKPMIEKWIYLLCDVTAKAERFLDLNKNCDYLALFLIFVSS